MSNTSGDVNDALDAALELTFPASDPIAVFIRDYDAWDGTVTHVERTARTSIARDEGGRPVVPLRFRARFVRCVRIAQEALANMAKYPRATRPR